MHRFASSLGLRASLLAVHGAGHFRGPEQEPFSVETTKLLRVLCESFDLLPFDLSSLSVVASSLPPELAIDGAPVLQNVLLEWQCSNLDLAEGLLCPKEGEGCLQVVAWINGEATSVDFPEEGQSHTQGALPIHLKPGEHNVRISVQVF